MIEMSDFAKTLMSAVETYTNDVAVATKKAIRKTANQAKKIAVESGKYKDKSGEYRDAIQAVKGYEDNLDLRIHVTAKKNHQYSLTHLLEKGHIMPNGERSAKYPHINIAQEYADEHLSDNIRKEISKL